MTRPASRGVLFDATGTLIEVREPIGETYRRIALAHGVDLPAWRLDDAFRRVLRHAPTRGLHGDDETARREGEVAWWLERLRQTFQAADSTARFADFPAFARAAFDAYRDPGAWRVREGVDSMLDTLRAAGLPLGVVSNFDHRLPEILEALGLASAFATLEIPSRHGVAKPDRAIFAAAAEALGQPLEALAYVGDDPPERLEAIAALGLVVLDVSRHPAAVEWASRLGIVADATLPLPDPPERPRARR
jgi:putative hydrolase of the HAD superfamily